MGLRYYVMYPFGTQPNTTMNHLRQLSRLGHPKPVWTPSAAAWLKKQISIVISAALNSRAIFQSNRLKKSQTSAIQALAQIQILRGNSAEIGVWPNFRATRIDFGKFFRSF